MATAKRTIRGEQYNVAQLVDNAIAAVKAMELDTDAARSALQKLGHRDPEESTINRYARESAILNILQDVTGAAFTNQIGKINFTNRDRAIVEVNAYLNRRIQGMRQGWGK